MDPARISTPRANSPTETLGGVRLPAGVAALLDRLARELEALYGEERYRELVLYGSYARGEADEGSNVDLLLLLEGEVDPARELLRVEPVEWPLSLDAGYTISLLPISTETYLRSEEPFLRNARKEGIPTS